MSYTTNPKAQYVWDNARPVRGMNQNLYRSDGQGNIIYKPAYGRNSRMGWQVDHIWPKSRGGSNRRSNLQALQTRANKRKSNKLPTRGKARNRRRK